MDSGNQLHDWLQLVRLFAEGEDGLPYYATALVCVGGVLGAILAAYFLIGRLFHVRLSRHATFTPVDGSEDNVPAVQYAAASHPLLQELRKTFGLTDVAGDGSDFTRLVRVMNWVHGLTTHARNPSHPERITGLHLAKLAQQGKRINCWMYSIILNDAILALGIPSRIIHLLPPKKSPGESHVVITFYCRDLRRWVMLDADMNGFVTDEDGAPLGVREIRRRIVDRRPLRVSDSVHMKGVSFLRRGIRKRLYLWYLSKNIFRMSCPMQSEPDYETAASGRRYLQLIPDDYNDEWLSVPRRTSAGNEIRYTRDEDAFWQAP